MCVQKLSEVPLLYNMGFSDFLTGGGRIRDVASLIRRTDKSKIRIFFWGKKSKKGRLVFPFIVTK